MVKFLSWIIRCYKKLLSPWLGQNCRFYPSCSSYFLEALERHGAIRGSLLGVKRLCRCHPLHEGGLDPVPGTCSEAGDNLTPEYVTDNKDPAVNGY